MAGSVLTPLMRQYFQIKETFSDTLLLFQVGDFYEFFFDDAIKASKFLGIALTQRGKDSKGEPIPLCGVPVHSLDHYLVKLVKGGFKVAICDQLEEAKPGRVVKRGVTKVLTPGTLTDSNLLDEKTASYLCIFFPTKESWTLIFVELLTGQVFLVNNKEDSKKLIESEINRFMPDEIVVPQLKFGLPFANFFKQIGNSVTLEEFDFNSDNLAKSSLDWFKNKFSNFNLNLSDDSVLMCIALLYKYLKRNNPQGLEQLKNLFVYNPEDFLVMDPSAQRNLELVKNGHNGVSTNTLFGVLDKAVTPMGSRTIKKWILRPLIKKEVIEQRLKVVQFLFDDLTFRERLQKLISGIGDLERVVGRIALNRAQLHDYIHLIRALEVVPEIKKELTNLNLSVISNISSKISNFGELFELLNSAIDIELNQKRFIKSGFNSELDRLRDLIQKGNQSILSLEKKEQESTGINSLKVKYNGTFGYSIEVTKPNIHLVPNHYMRIQTLTNRERYTTQELKDLEYEINRARNEIGEVETEVYNKVKLKVETYVGQLKKLSYSISYLDALCSLAEVAYFNNYVMPKFNENKTLEIVDGRHPVVEQSLREKFIPNSTLLSDEQSLWIITGPNMGGKSTFLRQVALICIMAQIGSFVPANQANLFIVDKIFTRIGAGDNVSEGKSTFLVEMEETAQICNKATENSLVILDEVGRGTSTFDGLAIAQAVVEYIFNQIKAKCLFATHYHELTSLGSKFNGIASYYAASTKTKDGIILLHKILPGVADGSFGLEVAKLAKLPDSLIQRSFEILKSEIKTTSLKPSINLNNFDDRQGQKNRELEAYLDQLKNKNEKSNLILDKISQIDCEQLTAKQALDFLWELKDQMS